MPSSWIIRSRRWVPLKLPGRLKSKLIGMHRGGVNLALKTEKLESGSILLAK